MTGFAPSFDDAGNVFVVTGNGDFSPPDDYGESVLKLNGETLKVMDYFTLDNYPELNKHDGDLGSGGIVLLSQDFGGSKMNLAAIVAKDPVLYLLDQANLGQLKSNDVRCHSGASLQIMHIFHNMPGRLGRSRGIPIAKRADVIPSGRE